MEQMKMPPGDDPNEREWVGTGERQEATQHRLAGADAEFTRRYVYATKSETHLWIVTITHYASDVLLESLYDPDASPMLDTETIATMPAIGCYVCEEPYDPRLRHRKCKGEPRR